MATVVKIVLTVLTAGYVLSQSTTDDSELPLNIQIQLQLTTLEYQHQQLAEVLNDLLEHQQQQLKKLNELQTMLTNRLAHCSIEVLAYAANNDGTPRYGYVKLNAVPVWQSSWSGTFPNARGVNVFRVNPFNCSVLESRRYDTHGDKNAATELRNYLQQLNRGSVVVAATADEPTANLASALSILKEMGADVSNVQHRGSFGFVAQKGFPAKTVLRKALTMAESNTNQPRFNATITGCSVDDLSITVV